MADKFGTAAHKRDCYLQIMQKAQQLNDQNLIKLIIKKLTRLGMTCAVSSTSGCIIIPFPGDHYSTKVTEYERPSWWLLFKLTLAIPGSLAKVAAAIPTTVEIRNEDAKALTGELSGL